MPFASEERQALLDLNWWGGNISAACAESLSMPMSVKCPAPGMGFLGRFLTAFQ